MLRRFPLAATSLLKLIDDIATLLDNVAAMTKIAAKKTAGVLGDDLALNAEQVTGVRADRELPVVWAVAKGSAINKLILVPAAMLISAVAPWGVMPLLMLGGLFLCFEGVEKVVHKLVHQDDAQSTQQHVEAVLDEHKDLVAFEREKIRGAVRTDFVLSAEIVVITLGTVATVSFGRRLAVLAAVSALMTVGVYGIVAGIVKLDDAGAALLRRSSARAQWLGRAILWVAPRLMKALSVAGTIAMFLVGGGILSHGVGFLAHWVHALEAMGGVVGWLLSTLLEGMTGVLAGAVVLGVVKLISRLKSASIKGHSNNKPT